MTFHLGRVFGAAVIAATLPLAGAVAQESGNRVAVTSDWNVFTEESPKECWGVTVPKESVNTRDGQPVSVRRGDILLFLTYRPGNDPEISFTGGYPFADGSSVGVDVDGKTFELKADGEWAWAVPGTDGTILDAMKNGSQAVLTARSGKGTQTKDTFSLRGFTAAVTEAATRCK